MPRADSVGKKNARRRSLSSDGKAVYQVSNVERGIIQLHYIRAILIYINV
jgi:hypothetical protein